MHSVCVIVRVHVIVCVHVRVHLSANTRPQHTNCLLFRVHLAKQFETLLPYMENMIPESKMSFLIQFVSQVYTCPRCAYMYRLYPG